MKYLVLAAALAASILIPSCGSATRAVGNTYDPGEEMHDIAYGQISKDNATEPVRKIKLEKNHYSNMADYLRGRVPGLTVGSTPTDGSKPSIHVNGSQTIYGDGSPLILLDGLKIDNIMSIDPNIVDYVEVLKGASATIYGAEGGNGVIMIVTKKK